MITPFDSIIALEIIDMINNISYSEIIISVTQQCFTDNTFRADTVFEISSAYELWVYACIYDDILNNNDYSTYCSYNGEGYSDEYISARLLMKCELLTGTSVYNIQEIIPNIVKSLEYMMGIECHSELMEYMKSKNIEEEFKSTVINLQNNLKKRIK
ncbi:MAG: hypothetical protein K2J32_01515 [Ruminococcus sp.]|nr:hypothetical protein [Ruminococcus sp.]